jgi:type III secretory pathway component EscU
MQNFWENKIVFNRLSLISFCLGMVFATVGALGFFSMEFALSKHGYKISVFNNIKRILEIRAAYARLIEANQAAVWPAKLFLIALYGFIISSIVFLVSFATSAR